MDWKTHDERLKAVVREIMATDPGYYSRFGHTSIYRGLKGKGYSTSTVKIKELMEIIRNEPFSSK